METLALSSTCRPSTLRVATSRATEFIDLTDRLEAVIDNAGILFGFVNVQTLHTTTAIVLNEHEPLLLCDFAALLERAVPRGDYWHDDADARTANLTPDERVNGHAHCRALLLPSSICLNIVNGRLRLGRWQRVFFVELDGPREREVSVLAMGESVL